MTVRLALLGLLLGLTGCEGGLFGNELPDCRNADAVITDPLDRSRTFNSHVRVCRTSNTDWYVSPRFQ